MKKTQTKAFANLIASVFFIILGVWAYIQTTGFRHIDNTYVQPSAFPLIMICGLLFFSVFLLLQSAYRLIRPKEGDYFLTKAETVSPRDKGVIAALITIVLCIVFVALFDILGYVLDSMVISFVIMYMIGKRNWLQMVLVSVLVPLAMWLIFYKVLTVNIPMGPLTFLRDLVDMI